MALGLDPSPGLNHPSALTAVGFLCMYVLTPSHWMAIEFYSSFTTATTVDNFHSSSSAALANANKTAKCLAIGWLYLK